MTPFTSVKNPCWANADHSLINCIVKFEHLKVEVPFTASVQDVEPHGREIFKRCVSGEYGLISDFLKTPDVDESLEVLSDEKPIPVIWPEIYEFLNQANNENASGTSRGIILVWSSMVEQLLGRLLESFLVDHKISKELISDDAHSSLGTFSGRAKCCFALGLISKSQLTVCDHVRKIRNAAAHEWNLDLNNASFSKFVIPALRALYNADHSELHHWRDDDLRYMIVSYYTASCAILMMQLINRSVEISEERRVYAIS